MTEKSKPTKKAAAKKAPAKAEPDEKDQVQEGREETEDQDGRNPLTYPVDRSILHSVTSATLNPAFTAEVD